MMRQTSDSAEPVDNREEKNSTPPALKKTEREEFLKRTLARLGHPQWLKLHKALDLAG